MMRSVPALLVLLVAILGPSIAAGQSTPTDTKGFGGAEWGMTPEQVASALGQPLGAPLGSDDGIKYVVRNFAAGAWTAGQVTFLFSRSADKTTLNEVVLDLQKYEYQPIRDEVKAKYGAPTSEKLERDESEAIWVLPSTQIRLSQLVIGGRSFMGLYYSRRRPSIF